MTDDQTTAQPAQTAQGGPTAGGEGVGTGETAETRSGGSALDAAIEAATRAVHDGHCSPECRESPTTMGTYRTAAEAAVRAAAPILRQAVAEEIARRIEAKRPSARRFWDSRDAARVYALNDAAEIAREVGR